MKIYPHCTETPPPPPLPHIAFIATSFSLSSRLLQDHHQLFTKVYEKWEVTVNYHMILHLPDMISDLGPPHTFWCFGYERMNGILAGTPNSNRCIELEVMNRFVMDTAFSNTCTPNVQCTAPSKGIYSCFR